MYYLFCNYKCTSDGTCIWKLRTTFQHVPKCVKNRQDTFHFLHKTMPTMAVNAIKIISYMQNILHQNLMLACPGRN